MDMQNIETQLEELKAQVEAVSKKTAENKLAMVVFSGELDKVLAAFVIATGAVAMGMDVVMFFTFWGTPVLRDKNKKVGGKGVNDSSKSITVSPAAQRNRRCETIEYEYGWHGYGNDEISHEKEKCGVAGGNVGPG